MHATLLDPGDPLLLRDQTYDDWRAALPAAVRDTLVGLRVSWRWTAAQQRQAPDVSEFRVYYHPGTVPPQDWSQVAVWDMRCHVSAHGTGIADGNGDRTYEVLLTVPGTADPFAAGVPLVPTLADPIVYAQVTVSAADAIAGSGDRWPGGGLWASRAGNESRAASPVRIARVLREPSPPPEPVIDSDRVYASVADWHGHSYHSFRWRPVEHLRAHVCRAMDEAVFTTDWAARPRADLDPADDARFPDVAAEPAWNDAKRAAVAAALNALNTLAEDGTGTHDALAVYRGLSDDELRILANGPGNERAFTQLTPVPLDPAAPDTADRRGPDDVADYQPRPALCRYLDELDGRASNRYVYRALYVDAANNRSALGAAGVPVRLPDVVAPRPPAAPQATAGNRQVTLSWPSNRESDLAEYRIYRALSSVDADDIRTMTLQATIAADADSSARPAAETWVEDDIPGLEGPLVPNRRRRRRRPRPARGRRERLGALRGRQGAGVRHDATRATAADGDMDRAGGRRARDRRLVERRRDAAAGPRAAGGDLDRPRWLEASGKPHRDLAGQRPCLRVRVPSVGAQVYRGHRPRRRHRPGSRLGAPMPGYVASTEERTITWTQSNSHLSKSAPVRAAAAVSLAGYGPQPTAGGAWTFNRGLVFSTPAARPDADMLAVASGVLTFLPAAGGEPDGVQLKLSGLDTPGLQASGMPTWVRPAAAFAYMGVDKATVRVAIATLLATPARLAAANKAYVRITGNAALAAGALAQVFVDHPEQLADGVACTHGEVLGTGAVDAAARRFELRVAEPGVTSLLVRNPSYYLNAWQHAGLIDLSAHPLGARLRRLDASLEANAVLRFVAKTGDNANAPFTDPAAPGRSITGGRGGLRRRRHRADHRLGHLQGSRARDHRRGEPHQRGDARCGRPAPRRGGGRSGGARRAGRVPQARGPGQLRHDPGRRRQRRRDDPHRRRPPRHPLQRSRRRGCRLGHQGDRPLRRGFEEGAGIYCHRSAGVLIASCHIHRNIAFFNALPRSAGLGLPNPFPGTGWFEEGSGGGIGLYRSHAIIWGNLIERNLALYGAAIGLFASCYPTIAENHIRTNHGPDWFTGATVTDGGAIRVLQQSLRFDSLAALQAAVPAGSAVSPVLIPLAQMYDAAEVAVTQRRWIHLRGNRLEANIAEDDGGGVYATALSRIFSAGNHLIANTANDGDGGGYRVSTASVLRSIGDEIRDNRVRGSASKGATGGGIAARCSSLYLLGTIVDGHTTHFAGAGVSFTATREGEVSDGGTARFLGYAIESWDNQRRGALGFTHGELMIEGTTVIANNLADDSSRGKGGGLYVFRFQDGATFTADGLTVEIEVPAGVLAASNDAVFTQGGIKPYQRIYLVDQTKPAAVGGGPPLIIGDADIAAGPAYLSHLSV